MKIAISVNGSNLDSMMDSRFGRTKSFMIFDDVTEEFEIINNEQNYNAAQGAGIQSAKNILESGASVIISGHCGPKAFAVLQSAGIKVFCSEVKSIKDVISDYRKGLLSEISGPDVEGHW